jgi:hypothetical protein
MAVYIMAVRIVAMSRPPHPPSASPNCQPEISPEMTYATPSPARSTQPAAPFCNCRCCRYSSPTCSYSTPCVVRLSSRSLIWTSFSRPYSLVSPTNLVITGTLTGTDPRVNSLPEIPFSRFAQQSRIEYLWSIVETISLRGKYRNQDDRVHQRPRDGGRGLNVRHLRYPNLEWSPDCLR